MDNLFILLGTWVFLGFLFAIMDAWIWLGVIFGEEPDAKPIYERAKQIQVIRLYHVVMFVLLIPTMLAELFFVGIFYVCKGIGRLLSIKLYSREKDNGRII